MRKTAITVLLLALCQVSLATGIRDSIAVRKKALKDTLEFSNEFLDTVKLRTQKSINDYSLLGVNYGVTFTNMYFTPKKQDNAFHIRPNYISVTYTHFSKLFDTLPYCGIVVGASYGSEGFYFLRNIEGYYSSDVDGATECEMKVFEVPAMAELHFDRDPLKFMVYLGVYGGYRKSINRSGPDLAKEFERSFRSYERHWDYGLQGGVGLGLIFSPIEIHFNCLVRWSWSNFYEPNYYNPQYHPQNDIYYRFAYPLDIMATVGVHFQLTKRTGKTTSQLKNEAKAIVYGTN